MTESERAVKQVLDGVVTAAEAASLIVLIVAAFYGWLWLLRM
jgi:hypothetical protein